MILSKTPYRISLFGGGTDFPEWFNTNKSLVISTTIDKYANMRIRYLPPFFEKKNRIIWSKVELVDNINNIAHPSIRAILRYFKETKGVEVHHYGDLPARSGIGSSSSFAVGFLNLLFYLHKQKKSKKQLSEIAIHIEKKILNEEGGWQDQVIVSKGGFNEIEFFNNRFKASSINIDYKTKKKLDDSLLLFYTGVPRYSSDLQKVFKKNIKSLSSELKEITEITLEAKKIILSKKNFDELGKLLHETWLIKKTFTNKISNHNVDEIYNIGIKAGAIGGKLLGAGNNGFILFYCNSSKQKRLISKLKKFVHVPFNFEDKGAQLYL